MSGIWWDLATPPCGLLSLEALESRETLRKVATMTFRLSLGTGKSRWRASDWFEALKRR
jgi:hypothetical protein